MSISKDNLNRDSIDYTWRENNLTMAGKNQQVALVVGASRGIGRQVAIDLAKNGYTGMSAKLSIWEFVANGE